MAGVYINISNAPENNGWNDHLHLFLGQMEPEAPVQKLVVADTALCSRGEVREEELENSQK